MDAPPLPPGPAPPPQAPSPTVTTCSITVQPPALAAPPVSLPAMAPPPLPSLTETTWPRPARWALVVLLILATGLLAAHTLGSLRWWTRPTELERSRELGYRIDLNQASAAELMQIPGVGDKKARRIIEHRAKKGPFRKVSDLLNVKGVGSATLERLRPWVCVDSEEADEEDTQPIVVAKGKPRAKKETPARKAQGPKKLSKKAALLKGKLINVNQASAKELQQLPYVGPATAQCIIAERWKQPFTSIDDLKRVRGIKDRILEHLRPHVTVNGKARPLVKPE